MSAPTRIDVFSNCSLFLKCYWHGRVFASGTGFIVGHANGLFLFTNWHVVTGRDPDSNRHLLPASIEPDEIGIMYHASGFDHGRVERRERLYTDEGVRRWIEHPTGCEVDVVALRLPFTSDRRDPEISTASLSMELANAGAKLVPAMPVSIIGYPLGISDPEALPIWKTGHIASDPEVDFGGHPAFLIDATTRGGMSGSPVLFRTTGGSYPTEDGLALCGGIMNQLLGVYSAQYPTPEIGVVWKPRVMHEILAEADRTLSGNESSQ